MTNRQVGLTPPGLCPPYMNVCEVDEDHVRVSVRGIPRDGRTYGELGEIEITKIEWQQFVIDVAKELEF